MNVYPLGIHQKKQISNDLTYFIRARDTYRSDLPESILLPEDPDYDIYLCRVNIFGGISLRINSLIIKWIITNDWTFHDFFNFIDKRFSLIQHSIKVRTTAEEVTLIVSTVHRIISKLELLPKK
jgi:hypothetical protein